MRLRLHLANLIVAGPKWLCWYPAACSGKQVPPANRLIGIMVDAASADELHLAMCRGQAPAWMVDQLEELIAELRPHDRLSIASIVRQAMSCGDPSDHSIDVVTHCALAARRCPR